MPFWPVAAREARAAARAPRTYAWRAAITALGIAAVPIALSSPSARAPGAVVFVYVSSMAFLYCLFGGMLRTADAIAEEKRENTLGLLFLTDLKAADVISGKLLASSATLFFGLLSLLPLLAIPMTLGGVTGRQMAFMAVCLVNSLFFSISCGFLISTIFRQGWITISVGLATMLGFCVVIPLLAENFVGPRRNCIEILSPLNVFIDVIDNYPRGDILQAFAVTHLLAWLNILITAKLLATFWQDRPLSARAQKRWEQMARLRFGGSAARKRFRTRLLNKNPLFWLSGREQVSSGGLMTLLMFIAALSLITGWKEVFAGLIIMHAMLVVRMASAASHALAEDRKSGALELLLATSLSVGDVLKGRWMALGRQFFGPILIVSIWHIFSILWVEVMGGLGEAAAPMLAAIPALALAWVATGAFGMWMGLRARHPTTAIWGTLGAVLLGPWLLLACVYSLLAAFEMLPDFRFQSRVPFITIGIFLWAFYLFVLRVIASSRVRKGFREAATDRYRDTQPIDWRPFRRLMWKASAAAALVVLSVWGLRAWINYSGKRTLLRALAAHPEFQIAEPFPPYVPAEQNLARWEFVQPVGGDLVRVVRSGPITNLQSVIYAPSISWGEYQNWRAGKLHPIAQRKAHGLDQKLFDSDMQRLYAAAAKRPSFVLARSPDLSVGGNFYYLHNWVGFLASRAETRLANNEQPTNDIALALRFANALTNDPQAFSSRSQYHAVSRAIQPVYDGIQLGRWTDADLKMIQDAFEQIDPLAQFHSWQHLVVRTAATALTNPPTQFSPNLYGNIVPFFWGTYKPASKLPGRLEAQQARIISEGLDEMAKVINPRLGTIDLTRRQQFQAHTEWLSTLMDIVNNHLRQGALEFAMTRAMIELVTTACAIERFRLAEGRLPAMLEQLVPKYIGAVPIDPMTARPLIYHPKLDSYRLYSVGADGQDNGGVPGSADASPGLWPMLRRDPKPADWVWIYEQ